MEEEDDPFYNVEFPEPRINDEELDELLEFYYDEADWSKGKPCTTRMKMRYHFVDREAAKMFVNRMLTALERIRAYN